jgi:membrane fusion protein (multidrug efflux system)
MKSQKKLLLLMLLPLFFLSACGQSEEPVSSEVPPVPVKVQSVSDSSAVKQSFSYPGLVVSDSEASVIAKSSGTITGLKVKVGDQVAVGQELAKIDEVNSSFNAASFNAGQIKQAQIAVASAETAYNLAKSNYENILVSSVKDLRSAEITRDQAAKGQINLDITTSQSIKSAELAYETAKIATEQARTTLENRERSVSQSNDDVITNAGLAADSAISATAAVITNINNIAGLDDDNKISIPYRPNLGAMDASAYDQAKQAYQIAKQVYKDYSAKQFSDVSSKLDGAIKVVEAGRNLSDKVKFLFDKSISSDVLPQTSSTGNSLNNLQSAAAGYQTQMNSAANQANAAKQSLANTGINNSTALDSLRQAYQIAIQQEASAKQSLANLKSGNASQQDQAGFNVNLAQNQYENTRVKIESQVSSSRMQMESAKLQYNNAVTALQSLYDSHSLISPIAGTVTKLPIADGQTVSQGQVALVVSQPENLKIQFYVEADNLQSINPGLPAKIIDAGGTEYSGLVVTVSPQADSLTKRFLAEVKLDEGSSLLLGTVVDVKLDIIKNAASAEFSILPLSAITIGQNEKYIFIADNGVAKKVPVEVNEVIGEYAQIKTDLAANAAIVIDGNRLLREGQTVKIE